MTAFIVFLMCSFIAGLCLARFNAFSILMATAASAISVFSYDMIDGSTLVNSFLSSLAVAAALQAGYLVGQVLRRPNGGKLR
ncbi:MAG TPA: hypothetical protein VFH89_12750 [Sphingomicrobium sp.]|nr:hypothetical protein [Sphingomicrobium sp.]